MKRFLLIIALVFSSCSQIQYGDKNDVGNSYYFNSVTGDNSNLGTKENPFKSLDFLNNINLSNGDKILLANGSTFLNTIDLINEDGIEISNYKIDGNSKLPIINSKGKIASIFIENSSNININNVEMTANGGGANKYLHKKLKTDLRAGILYLVTDNKIHSDLKISYVNLRDIFYENPGYERNESEVRTPNGTKSYGWGIRVLNLSKSGNLENISIRNSNFTNISHTAIRFIGKRENQFLNLKIFGNKVFKTGGPGMVFNSCRNLLAKNNDINYSGSFDDSRKWGRGSGLWTWGTSYALITQNSFQNANGPADSAGCHIDFNCNDVIVEKNLSRNNAGGFIEILGNNYNCSYRYNVSINDGHRVKGKNGAFQEGKVFWLSGYTGRGQERNGPFNSYIYGNYVYVGEKIIPKIAVDKASKGVFVANNIFYFENDPVMVLGDQYKPDPGGGSKIKNVFFENNIFRKNHWPSDVLIQPVSNLYPKFKYGFKSQAGLSLKYIDLYKSLRTRNQTDLSAEDFYTSYSDINGEKYANLYNYIKLNVDNDTELASKFGITTTNLNKIDFHEEFFGIYPPDAVDTYALESEKYELPYPGKFKKIKVEYIQEDSKGLWKGFDVGYVFYGYSL